MEILVLQRFGPDFRCAACVLRLRQRCRGASESGSMAGRDRSSYLKLASLSSHWAIWSLRRRAAVRRASRTAWLSSLLLAAGTGFAFADVLFCVLAGLFRVDLCGEGAAGGRVSGSQGFIEMGDEGRETHSSNLKASTYMTATKPVKTKPAKRPFHRLMPRKHRVLPVYMGLPKAHQTLNGKPSTISSIRMPK